MSSACASYPRRSAARTIGSCSPTSNLVATSSRPSNPRQARDGSSRDRNVRYSATVTRAPSADDIARSYDSSSRSVNVPWAHRGEQERLRVVAFAFLTPFFFLKGGLNVSLSAVFANLGLLGVLFAAKLIPKLGLVYPLARRAEPQHAPFITLLMSTGLTFGAIASLYGLNAHIIDRTQFSLLVTVVVLSAIVPTAIAQRRHSPLGDLDRHTHPVPAEEYV
jgi:hypothetical protein